MIKEAYCSFEVAKLLKEKGFDEPCMGYYHTIVYHANEKEIYLSALCEKNSSWMGDCISAPTHQMAMAWLREVYHIHIDIGYDDLDWYWNIISIADDISPEDRPKMVKCGTACHRTYEQAVESALKYSLENLMKED